MKETKLRIKHNLNLSTARAEAAKAAQSLLDLEYDTTTTNFAQAEVKLIKAKKKVIRIMKLWDGKKNEHINNT